LQIFKEQCFDGLHVLDTTHIINYVKHFIPRVFLNKNEAATEPSLFDFGHDLPLPRKSSGTRLSDYVKGDVDKNR
jgi:hypothetical protein